MDECTDKCTDKRLANLIPWQKGQSGNPAGKRLGQRNYSTIYREALIKIGESLNKTPDELEIELISAGLLLAKKGNYAFYKDILDRIHGTAVAHSEAKHEHSGIDKFVIVRKTDYKTPYERKLLTV